MGSQDILIVYVNNTHKNEVWDKVIISQACVIPPVHEGGGKWIPSMHHRSHD